MGAYMYPIRIIKAKQTVYFDEVVRLEGTLTLEGLQFVGDDPFDAEVFEVGTGYEITVYRHRKETNEERKSRVAGEEAYMAEYNKRHPTKLNEEQYGSIHVPN